MFCDKYMHIKLKRLYFFLFNNILFAMFVAN